MIIPKLQELIEHRVSPIYCKKHYPEFVSFLSQKYPNLKISEQCYLYYNGLSEPPKCKACGQPVTFRGINKGYSQYCSNKCLSNDPDVKTKISNTKNDKYGDPKYNNRDKATNTCLTKYGVKNPFQSESIKKKIQDICLTKYGVKYPSQSKVIQEHRENNTLKKYGVKHHWQLRETILKSKQTKLLKYGDGFYNNRKISSETYYKNLINNIPELIKVTDEGEWVCKCPHPDCDKCNEKFYITDHQIQYNRKNYNSETCTRLFPINSKSKLTNVEIFVKNILDEYDIHYIYNCNDVLFDDKTHKYKQIDFWIPDLNIGIECNGCLYHRTNIYSFPSKHKNYHMNKTNLSENLGIKLIQIWEDWMLNKSEIIRSILLNKLGLCNNTIYARKCIIEQIKCPQFIEDNHIQGNCPCGVSYVLIYNGEVVSAMTFGKRKGIVNKYGKEEWELLRFCNKINTRIVGGASKLLSRFIKDYQPHSIVSFASRDISDGNLYKTLGFHQEGKPQSSYWYIGHNHRYHRSTFSKSKLIQKGWGDINQTEFEIMDKTIFHRIYDSGTTKWILKLN